MTSRLRDRAASLWIAGTEVSDPVLLDSSRSILDEDENRTLRGLRLERKRIEFVVAHALVRIALSSYSDIDPRAWRFSKGIHGKPEVCAPLRTGAMKFNLAHTKGIAICAVANDEVGVDVENLNRSIPPGIAQRFFAPDESAAIETLDSDSRSLRFFELWTLKEAISKGLGLGLGIELDRFHFTLTGDTYPKSPVMVDRESSITNWKFVLLRPFESCLAAVAMPNLEQVSVHLVDLTASIGGWRQPDDSPIEGASGCR